MELISKVSKGTKMDQIYIPKQREGFPLGSYVLIKTLETAPEQGIKLFPRNLQQLEPIKLSTIREIAQYLKSQYSGETIVFGSFLNPGFKFNDMDIILLSDAPLPLEAIQQKLEEKTGIKTHLTVISQAALQKGISTDPLFSLLMARYIATKRLLFNVKRELNFKLLDLHLQKSKMFLENFEFLTGNEKLKTVRNLIAIEFFLKGKKFPREGIAQMIDQCLGKGIAEKISENTIKIEEIARKYKALFALLQKKILEGISHGAQQE